MIELEVPFAEKDAAKALGARWNPQIKKWYIPDQLEDEKVQFAKWLPEPLNNTVAEQLGNTSPTPQSPDLFQPNTELAQNTDLVEEKGVSLSQLMRQVQTVLRGGFPGAIWVKAEIASLSERRGHLYLELVETNEAGQELAKTRAHIWKSLAPSLLTRFEQETGSALAVGQKVLLLAEVRFHEKFSFSLDIQDIDTAFTLGALEARLNQIRKQLIAEKLYENNKRFAMPEDFFRVAVIAPPQAAGLGDFRVDADLLQKLGLCEFHYFYSTFQGEQAVVEGEMQAAFQAYQSLHVSNPFDALVIIRGGGAKLDLNPLNSYDIARHIALAELPVLTGIGHERDSTILDEVAAVRFDTPSKVVAAIRQTIFAKAQQAKLHWIQIERSAQQKVQAQEAQLEQLEQRIFQQSQMQLQRWKSRIEPLKLNIQHASQQCSQTTHHQIEQHQQLIQQVARSSLQSQRHQVEQLNQQIQQQAQSKAQALKHQIEQWQQFVEQKARQQVAQTKHQMEQQWTGIENRVRSSLQMHKKGLEHAQNTIEQQASKQLQQQKQSIKQLISFILSSGPKQQLERGFALVKTSAGEPIKNKQQALKNRQVTLEFSDGAVTAEITGEVE